jgi:hypothetical protein
VLLEQVKDMTPRTAVEQWLNKTYGPASDLYDTRYLFDYYKQLVTILVDETVQKGRGGQMPSAEQGMKREIEQALAGFVTLERN